MEQLAHLPPRRRRRRAEPHVSHERWLVSYADFITLLFAFFTMMYAMSTVDAQKFKQVVQAMQVAFDNGQARPTGLNAILPADKGVGEGGELDGMELLQAQITQRLQGAIDNELVEVERDARGIVISIREAGSFTTGSADLSVAAHTVLDQVADIVGTTPNAVRIEGHTDDVPINTARFKSNWELSTARATNVIEYLARSGEVDASRLSAAGYAEFHPRVPNDSAASRARNRRVDIIILNAAIAQAEEPRAEGDGR
ncbi:MAG: flagellar motor protein MotB [Vicinamibacterales bacterium]